MKKLLLICLIGILLVGCGKEEIEPEKLYKTIDDDLAFEFLNDSKATLIDVRSKKEYEEGMRIKYSVNLPIDSINEKSLEDLIESKNSNVIIYGKDSKQSKEASLKIIELGYINVYDSGSPHTWDYRYGDDYVDNSDKIFDANMQTMKESAISYFTTERLPKNVGDKVTLKLKELVDMKFLLPFTDKNGDTCDTSKSYVSLEKNETDYIMTVYLKCNGKAEKQDYVVGNYTYCTSCICEKIYPDSIVITQYEAGSSTQLKIIDVFAFRDIEWASIYIKKLSPLKADEMVNLELLQEIVIEYGDSISVGIQLGETQYCYYTNKEKNISSLSKMPNGLYEWVVEKLDS